MVTFTEEAADKSEAKSIIEKVRKQERGKMSAELEKKIGKKGKCDGCGKSTPNIIKAPGATTYICDKCLDEINRKSGIDLRSFMTATTESLPVEAKKDIDYDPKKYKGKGMIGLSEDDEFDKERKEHPSFTDEQIKQIVKDHAKLKKGKAEMSAGHGETFHHKDAKKTHRFSFMPEYAEMGIAFLKEGEYEQNGNEYFYPWEVIEANKDTYKGRQFYTEHAEKAGEEFGEIKSTFTQVINGENWLCAIVKIPEANFTQDYLERAENGLIKEYSTGHRFDYETHDGKKVITKIYGDEISSTWRGLVPGTKTLFVKRHIKPSIDMSGEKRKELKAKLMKR